MELKLDGAHCNSKGFSLLIVPYGIETSYYIVRLFVPLCPFNRTLWN